MPNTLYWHDYETFGTDPRCDRPVQFAGIRTDEALNEIGEPLEVFARPAADLLPHPGACLITHITPRIAWEKGLPEAEFIERIRRELAAPGTCGVGYNSIRFDDEFTRYTLYRNLHDPYAREWRDGNSRWDIIDMVRAAHDLRPDGIEWPKNEKGRTSFRLELLTAANGIGHEQAHDAVSDVRATIALARLLKERKPRLYDYCYKLRHKGEVMKLVDPRAMGVLVHTSRMYSSDFGCTTLTATLAAHPVNRNSAIVYDLRVDPTPLLGLDAAAIRERLFTAGDDLPEGVERIPLKELHFNKSPVVAPAKTLDPAAAERLGIDLDACRRHWKALHDEPGLAEKIREVFAGREFPADSDPDHALYGGGFFSDDDRARMEEVHTLRPEELVGRDWPFDDRRLPEMLFRYRARNWPETLTEEEQARWSEYCHRRLTDPEGGANITLERYGEEIDRLRMEETRSEEELAILDELEQWGEMVLGG
ncbi:exodeoxyribonuclease I [Endothiovibrio diazotrophicus]